jgi:hypothetical protein
MPIVDRSPVAYPGRIRRDSRPSGVGLRLAADRAERHVTLVSCPHVQLLGRVTYEGFAAAWPSREDPSADKLNKDPKHVVSTTLKNCSARSPTRSTRTRR